MSLGCIECGTVVEQVSGSLFPALTADMYDESCARYYLGLILKKDKKVLKFDDAVILCKDEYKRIKNDLKNKLEEVKSKTLFYLDDSDAYDGAMRPKSFKPKGLRYLDQTAVSEKLPNSYKHLLSSPIGKAQVVSV